MTIDEYLINSCVFILFVLCPMTLAAENIFNPLDFSVGGRIKVDAIYNFNSVSGSNTSRADLSFSPPAIQIPTGNDEEFDLNVRESRLWATAHLPVNNIDLAGYVEIDFFGIDRDHSGVARLSNKPRLRHAYASYKGLTVGRTYTTFFNISSFPEINDSGGPLGVLHIRQELIQYIKQFVWGKGFFALEEPESTLISSTGKRLKPEDNRVPDIVGKIEFANNWGNWSLAGLLREIRAKGTVQAGIEDSVWGGAISAAGRIYLFNELDNVRFAISYGNTLGRYLSSNSFNDGAIDSAGNIELTEMIGGYLAYQHWWTSELRSSVILGMAYADQDTAILPATVNKFFASSHVNLLWSPMMETTVGIEWLHGYRELENGQDGNLDRIQLTAIYKF